MNFIEFVHRCKYSERKEVFGWGDVHKVMCAYRFTNGDFIYSVYKEKGDMQDWWLVVHTFNKRRYRMKKFKLKDYQISLLLLK